MDDAELSGWLRLTLTPGVGRRLARQLMRAFGPPPEVFRQPAAALAAEAGEAAASALREEPTDLASSLQRTRLWLAAAPRRRCITLGDPAFPVRWLQAPDPPLFVFAEGDIALLQAESIAVVGSRNPTPQGVDNARDFARALSEAGWTIVSGLALGIDAAAHLGGLDGPGRTVAVVGTGLDQDYPRRNSALAARIREEGLLVSEYLPGTPPLAPHFPQRNRLIAGLARGTLVVEAALQSGSLITARQALEHGSVVFAIPGSIHSPQSRGCHALIKQGAKLVETADDILGELPRPGAGGGAARRSDDVQPPAPGDEPASPPVPGNDDAGEDPLLTAMGFDPVGLDELVARTGIGAARLAARLLELELEGRVARLAGQRYQRRARG